MSVAHPPLTVGSLFTGIGGLDLGLERAGMTTKWQVEIDPFCNAVLEEHWPDVTRFTDVHDVGAHNLEPVDLICGGFPCQDISQAGRGRGITGSRSGLWSEFARIVGELRPRYVLVENVPTLKARGLEVILADLAESGYDTEWDCIPAISVGAPHRRDRLFLLAYPHRVGRVHGQARVHSAEVDDEAQRLSLSQAVLKPTWPTPTAVTRPNEGNVRLLRANVEGGVLTEQEATIMLNGKSPFSAQGKVAAKPGHTPSPSLTGGQLNPTWVEWLMGFPLGWTDLPHWVTRSSRRSRSGLVAKS